MDKLLGFHFFVAFTIFLEKIHVTWYLRHNCWFLVSFKHLWYPQGKGYMPFLPFANSICHFTNTSFLSKTHSQLPGIIASFFSRMSLPSSSSHSQAPRRTSPSLGRQAVVRTTSVFLCLKPPSSFADMLCLSFFFIEILSSTDTVKYRAI